MRRILAAFFILVILFGPVIDNKAMASIDEVPKLIKLSILPIDQFNHLE